jgi:transforming growth factor-beta-induced protein
MKSLKIVAVLLAAALLAAVAAPTFTAQAEFEGNVVDIAVNTPEFSILTEAVIAADLAGALSGPGPFTVFAPSDQAFVNALNTLGITKDQLFADKDLLTSILLYHVASGEYFASDVVSRSSLTMLDGNVAPINGATIAGANIVATDIDVSNGVIHAIDSVMLPPATITSDRSFEYAGNVVDIVSTTPEFSILTEAVVAAGLADTLSSGEWTVFAPSNAAFVAALDALGMTKDQLFADKELLTAVLLYHVIPAEVFAEDAAGLSQATMADGNTVSLSRDFYGLNINNANVIRADINVSNGVIHAIDAVLLPPMGQ